MQSPPMDAPAELRQRTTDPDVAERVIARGSVVLMAHALGAIDPPERRAACWIETAEGRIDAETAVALLRHWESGVPIEDRV